MKKELKDAAQTIAKYKELYHLAPIGYLSLSKTGQILEINLTAAQLLKKDSTDFKKFALNNMMLEDSKPIFNHFLWEIFTMNKTESCEIKLKVEGNKIIDVHLKGLTTPTQEQCLATITDVTEQKRTESELNKWATLFQPKGN